MSASSSDPDAEPTWDQVEEAVPLSRPVETYDGLPLLPTLSPELLTIIFHHCNTLDDAFSLALTNKQLYDIWAVAHPSIIWTVGSRTINAFDSALLAVRATHLLLHSYRTDTPPPVFVIEELTGEASKPSREELAKLLNMQHLVACVEQMYLYGDVGSDNSLWGASMLSSDFRGEVVDRLTPAKRQAWRLRFYRAMYRLLLMGAVLAPVYNEPFFAALDISETYLASFMFESEDFYVFFTPAQRVFLRKFAVYNYDVEDFSTIGKWRHEEYKKKFGPLARWIVGAENGEKSGFDRAAPAARGSSQADLGEENISLPKESMNGVEQLMGLLMAYEHLDGKLARGKTSHNPVFDSTSPATRTVEVFIFGSFVPEIVYMPRKAKYARKKLLHAQLHPCLAGTRAGKVFDMLSAPSQRGVERTFELLGRSSRTTIPPLDEHPEPPALFQFWFFALREYLGLGFRSGAFWQWRECLWFEDFGEGKAFLNPSWHICQPYMEGKVSWVMEHH